MVALRMSWHNAGNLEMQKAYMTKSPRATDMKVSIGFQAFFGLVSIFPSYYKNLIAVFCYGLGWMQTFHVRNYDVDPNSLTNWHFFERPDLSWAYAVTVGGMIFTYGFVGFWLCERKRKMWRINVHCMSLLLNLLSQSACSRNFDFPCCLVVGKYCDL